MHAVPGEEPQTAAAARQYKSDLHLGAQLGAKVFEEPKLIGQPPLPGHLTFPKQPGVKGPALGASHVKLSLDVVEVAFELLCPWDEAEEGSEGGCRLLRKLLRCLSTPLCTC